MTVVAQIYFFHGKSHFDKNVLGYILGEFFVNSYGHPDNYVYVGRCLVGTGFIGTSAHHIVHLSVLKIRVTRSGEFSPNGCLITSGIFVQNKKKTA
jgi:hypothetical protein